MAYYERDYFREPPRKVQASAPKLMAGGKFLLFLMIGVFLVVFVQEGAQSGEIMKGVADSELVKYLAIGKGTLLPLEDGTFQPWAVLTAGLLETNLITLVITCVVLVWLIGSRIEEIVGTRRFLIFWFSSIVVANVVAALLDPFVFRQLGQGAEVDVFTVGTIGVSCSILAAAALLFPDAKSFFDIRMKTLVYVLLGIQLLIVAASYFDVNSANGNAIASLPAGLVGIVWGRVFVKALMSRGLDIRASEEKRVKHLRRLEDEPEDFLSYARQFNVEEAIAEEEDEYSTALSRAEEKRLLRETEERRKVDFLLARISGEGIESLSRAERAFLERYSKRQRELSSRQ